MVAAKIANMEVGNASGNNQHERNSANLPNSTSNAQAAEKLNVSERTVRTAKKVIVEAEPEVIEAVEAGNMAVSTAVDIIELPPEEQVEIAALPKAEQRQEISKKTAIKRQICLLIMVPPRLRG